MRIVLFETRVMEEEIDRQRLIHPAEAEHVFHERAFRRLANETGTMHAFYRFEGAPMRRLNRALQLLSCCPEGLQTLQPVSNLKIGVRENAICETNLAVEIARSEIVETNRGRCIHENRCYDIVERTEERLKHLPVAISENPNGPIID